jgi:hypothetical protein
VARAGQHAPVSSPAHVAQARVKSAYAGGAASADTSWTEF